MKLYQRLPPVLRSLVASGRGYYLRSWRYTPETDRLVREAIARESWPSERWKAWQEEKVKCVLRHAVSNVPYYREMWARRRRSADTSSFEVLSNWPILDKEEVRRNPRAFVADGEGRRAFRDHSSGSTGKPLDLWISREALRSWYALFEARSRFWNGVSRRDRWAILGGQLIAPTSQIHPPFWVWNQALNQLYMSSYHLKPDFMGVYFEALLHHRIRYLYGYTSALTALAWGLLKSGNELIAAVHKLGLRAALTNAEPVSAAQKHVIAEAFGCPAVETYGMSEIVAGASECSAGSLHFWPEAGVVEIPENGAPVRPGSSGELVCTGLLNETMPLIRYRVGDTAAALVNASSICDCGRTLPRFASIEGRTDDVFFTKDGRTIGRLDPVFKTDLPIQEAQIIQETLDKIVVRYVPAPGFGESERLIIGERIRDRMGDVAVTFEAVTSIPRGPNGKFRAQLCRISPTERTQLQELAWTKSEFLASTAAR